MIFVISKTSTYEFNLTLMIGFFLNICFPDDSISTERWPDATYEVTADAIIFKQTVTEAPGALITKLMNSERGRTRVDVGDGDGD